MCVFVHKLGYVNVSHNVLADKSFRVSTTSCGSGTEILSEEIRQKAETPNTGNGTLCTPRALAHRCRLQDIAQQPLKYAHMTTHPRLCFPTSLQGETSSLKTASLNINARYTTQYNITQQGAPSRSGLFIF